MAYFRFVAYATRITEASLYACVRRGGAPPDASEERGGWVGVDGVGHKPESRHGKRGGSRVDKVLPFALAAVSARKKRPEARARERFRPKWGGERKFEYRNECCVSVQSVLINFCGEFRRVLKASAVP